MSSQTDEHNGHLDATAGREVVFCHACSNEWFREDHGLNCPDCGSDITEIIEPENDPRDLEHHSSASTSPEPDHRHYHDEEDSDPDEADITEFRDQHGFAFRRSVRDGSDPRHHNPAPDPVLERFLDMIHGFGGPPRRPAAGGLFPQGPGEQEHPFPQPRIHRTTFTSGTFGGGTTSVTIVSGSLPTGRAGGPPGGARPDPFQAIFSNIVRDIAPPEDDNHAGPEGAGGGVPPPAFARSLHDILSLFSPANAVAGDAVYSQEALDRIITSLMEANPQSNAAPPATEQALRNLPRKPVDKEMLVGDEKTECTICIDEMKVGDTVIYLPCKHWFHEDCVVLWLKEHNTCPICRTPIEKNEGNGRNNANSGNNNNTEGGESSARPSPFPTPQGGPSPFVGNPSWFSGMPGFGGPHEGYDGSQGRPTRLSRPPSQSQSRLNEALRSLQRDRDPRDRDRDRDRERDRGLTSGFSYDTSRLQRRSSHSPTSPRATGPEEHGARMRQRSPSQRRSSITDRDRDQRRRSSVTGPFSWLRDRFGGGGGGGAGSGNGSSRDERRQ